MQHDTAGIDDGGKSSIYCQDIVNIFIASYFI